MTLASAQGAAKLPASPLCGSSPRQCVAHMTARQLMDATLWSAPVPCERQQRWCSSARPASQVPCGSCAHRHGRRHGRHGPAVLCGSLTDAGGWTDSLGGGAQRSSQPCTWDAAVSATRGAFHSPACLLHTRELTSSTLCHAVRRCAAGGVGRGRLVLCSCPLPGGADARHRGCPGVAA